MTRQEIAQNIDEIKKRIEIASKKSERNPDDITLIAVSKTVDSSIVRLAYDHGIRDFGENKVQEIMNKYDKLPEDTRWHLIGHLQTNKVKYIIDKVVMIHSVDSYSLINEIESRAAKCYKVMDILLQVNVSGEETKFGVSPDEVLDYVRYISQKSHICLRGLMTIAQYARNAEETRPIFAKLSEIYIDIKKERLDNINMDYLSMGMSNDFEVAIEEGANLIRVGTSIFGERHYF